MTESWGNFESPEEKARRERDETFNSENRSKEREREIEKRSRETERDKRDKRG